MHRIIKKELYFCSTDNINIILPDIDMSIITLNNMEFHAYHGCMKHERELGNTFIVTVSMKLDTTKAGLSDNLQDTLNYQQVYDIVREQMQQPVNLIEHEAQRILHALTARFPEVEFFTVRLTKLNPPLGGKVDSVTIEINNGADTERLMTCNS